MLCTPGTSISRFSSVLVLLSWCLLLNLANRSSTIGVCVAEFATWSPICTSVVGNEIHIPITSEGCNRLFYFFDFLAFKPKASTSTIAPNTAITTRGLGVDVGAVFGVDAGVAAGVVVDVESSATNCLITIGTYPNSSPGGGEVSRPESKATSEPLLGSAIIAVFAQSFCILITAF